MSQSRFVAGMLALGLTIVVAGQASGQDYPYRPIRIITNAAGGGTDFVSRILAQGISGPLGQAVIVDNRGGVVNTMATMAKAPPDGYTLLVTGGGVWITPLLQKMNWDMEREYSPISHISRDVFVLVVHPSVAANSVQQLIALARAKPGVLNYGASAAGGPSGLGPELFKVMAGVNIVRIPYNGSSLVVNAILGGEVQVVITDPGLVMSHVKSGKLKALGITSALPSPVVPGMPTIAASGLPGYELVGAAGIWAPAKTPVAIINRINREVVRVLNLPDVKERLLNSGSEVVASSPEQFAAAIKADIAKTSKLIKEAGIKLE